MTSLNFPHRRRNALTGEWVLVSPHRTQRPWQGKQETTAAANRPAYDPSCYLCPGNTRANGEKNPAYTSPFVFTNDFAALLVESPEVPATDSRLFQASSARGECRVICFSPRHDLTLPEMEKSDIKAVVDVWSAQLDELGKKYQWVQIFENKGDVMGCSNPHPHGQIWASDFVPNEPAKEDLQQTTYFRETGRNLLGDYLADELSKKERVVVENEDWVGLVPYWAVWPFEVLLVARGSAQRLTDLKDGERATLADILKKITTRYDNLFQTSFPYSMGWHGAPTGPGAQAGDSPQWRLHAHFYPPLLRSATVKKFMVGYEMMAEAQRDLTAEQAADRLRACSEMHYKLAL
jgi:UDPglucose--hexose-1-phosphate uridylyltransferase